MKKEKTIRVIIKEPGRDPAETFLENSLEAFQGVVGGYIESCTLDPDWTVICNEEGRLYGLEDNCEILGVDFVGAVVLVGVDGDSFTHFPFTLEELREHLPELWGGGDDKWSGVKARSSPATGSRPTG